MFKPSLDSPLFQAVIVSMTAISTLSATTVTSGLPQSTILRQLGAVTYITTVQE
jgi:hypothetical protein